MRVLETTISPAILLACVWFVGCEKPELASDEEPRATEPEAIVPPMPSRESEEEILQSVAEKNEPEVETEEAPVKVEATLPKLIVRKEDGKITIGGKLKSPSHKDRIREQMASAFPDLEIVDNIEVDYDSIPVGWTSRVTEQLLVPFFHEVEDPYLDWIEGKITIKGAVKNQVAKRDLSITAIDTFAGLHSKDIDNQLEVIGE